MQYRRKMKCYIFNLMVIYLLGKPIIENRVFSSAFKGEELFRFDTDLLQSDQTFYFPITVSRNSTISCNWFISILLAIC